jgi:hypothetical protein
VTPDPGRRLQVEALSPGRYKVQFTASVTLRDKLERLTALMRSEVPDGDLAAVVERAVTEKLERLEARRFAKTAASQSNQPAAQGRGRRDGTTEAVSRPRRACAR